MRLYTLLLIACIFGISSCKKTDSANPSNVLTGKIKTKKTSSDIDPNIDSISYYFNSDGTLNYTNNHQLADPINYRSDFSYTYSPNKIVILQYDSIGNYTHYQELFSRTDGLLDSFAYKSGVTTHSSKYIYDANNSLTQLRTYYYQYYPVFPPGTPPDAVYSYTLINADIIKFENIPVTPGQSFSSYTTYDYFNHENNINRSSVGLPGNFPTSRHLLKTKYQNFYNPLHTDTVTSWVYTFDADGRVLSQKSTNYENGIPNGHWFLTVYTYY